MLSTKKGYTVAKIIGNKQFKNINIDDPFMYRMIQDDADEIDAIEDEKSKNHRFHKLDNDGIKKLVKSAKDNSSESESSDDEEEDLPRLNIHDLFSDDQIMKFNGSKILDKCKIPIQMLEKLENRRGKEFHIKSGYLQPIPLKEKMRTICYVSGPEGSGKSYYVAQMLRHYRKIYPKNDIYLFSNLDDDPAYDGIKNLFRIPIDENLINDPIDIQGDLAESACVFDDYEMIQSKPLKKYITEYLIPTLIKQGRKLRISVFMISHLLMNGTETKPILSAADTVTIYPQCGSSYQIDRYLKIHAGLSSEEIKRILKLPSRWVSISTKAPKYVMYQQGIYMI